MITKWLLFHASQLYRYPTLSRMTERERESQLPRITRKEAEGHSECYTLISEHTGLPWLRSHAPLLPLPWNGVIYSRYLCQPRDVHFIMETKRQCLYNKCLYTMVMRTRWVLRRWWIYSLNSWLQNNMRQISDEILISINIILGCRVHIGNRKKF